MKSISKLSLKFNIAILIGSAILMMILTYLIIYFNYSKITKERSKVYFNVISGQVQNKIKSDISDIEKLANSLIYSVTVQRYLLQKTDEKKFLYVEPLRNSIDLIEKSYPNVQMIKIIKKDGSFIKSSFFSENVNLQYHRKIVNDYKLQYAQCNKAFFTKCYIESDNVYYAYVAPINTVLEGVYSKSNVAVCIIYCKLKYNFKSIPNLEKMPKFMLAITNNNLLLSSYTNQKPQNKNEELKKNDLINIQSMKGNNIKYKNKKYIKLSLNIKKINWKVSCIVNERELIKDMDKIKYITITMIIISSILLLLIGILLLKNINSPIIQIVNNMNLISKKDSKRRIKIKTKNEIGFIAEHINIMLDEIDEKNSNIFYTQNALYEAELAKKSTELQFYQNQINPHFLYNTLECIRSIGQINKIKEITIICGSMAKIFRYSVKEKSIVSIKNELSCVEDYFNIMSIRYMGNFNLKIKVDVSIKKHTIMKMILQPIVENSILHGIVGKKNNSYIYIYAYFDDDSNIIIKIVDNGKGIEKTKLEKINKILITDNLFSETQKNKTSVGLENINNRLKLKYGKNYGLHINSSFGYYTCVTIKIPHSI